MRIYPQTKWSDTATSKEQYLHIREEYHEAERARLFESQNRLDEEISDLEHSIQTYWDCRAREGADVDAIRQKVIEKNRVRSYYAEGGCTDGGNADDTRQASPGS